MMHADVHFALATARHAQRVAAAERPCRSGDYPARSRRRWIAWLGIQPGEVAPACHGHGSDANRVGGLLPAPVARAAGWLSSSGRRRRRRTRRLIAGQPRRRRSQRTPLPSSQGGSTTMHDARPLLSRVLPSLHLARRRRAGRSPRRATARRCASVAIARPRDQGRGTGACHPGHRATHGIAAAAPRAETR